MKQPPILLFDLGGVLVEVTVFSALRSLTGCEASDDELREQWLRSPAVRTFELGEISPDEFARRFVGEWRLSLAPEVFLDDFVSWIGPIYDGVPALLTWLGESRPLALLTNCNEVHWAQVAPIIGLFDSVFASHLTGRIKPDDDAFRLVMTELCAQPEDLVFFDDARPNVDAAVRLGIRSFLVRGFEDLKRCMGQQGLL